MGGDQIFDELSEHLGVGHDETTDDGTITLERVECNAACDFAPVRDGQLGVLRQPDARVAPAAGRRPARRQGRRADPRRRQVCTFKQVSRVLAGFDDGRADEGVGAAGPAEALRRRSSTMAPSEQRLAVRRRRESPDTRQRRPSADDAAGSRRAQARRAGG